MDSAEQTYGQDSCGTRRYTIVLQGDATYTPVNYVSITEIVPYTTFRITTADEATLEGNEGVYQLALYVEMVNYPTSSDGAHPTLFSNFQLTVDPAVCDCSILTWIAPAAQNTVTSVKRATVEQMTLNHPVADATSKTTNAAIKSCYRAELVSQYAPCDETTTISNIVE